MGMRGLRLTQGALRLLRQTGKRFGFLGALASWWRGRHDWLAGGRGGGGPQTAEPQEDAPQRHESQLVDNEGRDHGNAPADNGEMRTW